MARGRRRHVGSIDRLASGRWRVRVTDTASGGRISIGTFRTKSEAEAAFAATLSDQRRGVWVAPEDGRISFEEYARSWLATRLTPRGEPLRPRTRELYEGYLHNHIFPTLGSASLGQITGSVIRRWHAQLLKDGPGLSTTAKCYRLVRAILNSAVEDRHLAVNPCTIRGAGVEPAEERRIPTVAEVYALAGAVSARFRAFILLYAFVGLRRGELLGLTRRNLDLLHRTVTVRTQRQESRRGETLIGPPKSEAGRRTVALPAEIVEDLDRHLATWAAPGPDGLIFVGEKGGPVRPGVLQTDWDRARRSVGLSHLHLHDLRHVAGTLAAATGAGTKEIMRRLGQSTPQAALRYQHATDERDRQVATGIDKLIQAARRPEGPSEPGPGAGHEAV